MRQREKKIIKQKKFYVKAFDKGRALYLRKTKKKEIILAQGTIIYASLQHNFLSLGGCLDNWNDYQRKRG